MIFKPGKISDFADEKHTCFFLIDLVNDCVFLCVINLSYFFFSPLELTQNNIKLSPTLLKNLPFEISFDRSCKHAFWNLHCIPSLVDCPGLYEDALQDSQAGSNTHTFLVTTKPYCKTLGIHLRLFV